MPLLIALAFAVTPVHAAVEWPQFHSDSLHTGTVVSDFESPTQMWWSRSTGGPIEGSPVVSDGRVFIGSTDGKLYAFDAISGSLLWTFDGGGPISGTPALSGGILYLVTNAGKLFALDAVTGKKRLSAGSGNPDPGPARTSPAIHQGRLYIGTEGGTLIAYSLEHLTKDWEFRITEEKVPTAAPAFNNQTNMYTSGSCAALYPTAKPIRSSPAVYDDKVFFGSDVHALFAVDEFGLGGSQAGSTSGVWRMAPVDDDYTTMGCPATYPVATMPGKPIHPLLGDVIRAAPAVDGDNELVIVPAFDNHIYAFGADSGSEEWAVDLGTGASNRSAATPAIAAGKAFFGLLNGRFFALNAATGATSWSFTAGDAVWSSAAASNGLVAFGADDETIYVLDANTGAKRWSHRIGGDVRSSPAIWTGEFLNQHINGGVLYVGGMDGILYAFGGEKPPLPDLKVASIDYPDDPLPLDADVEVNVTVLNAGNSSSPATELKLFIDGALASTQPVKALGAGENTSLVYVWKVPASNHTITASVDPAGLSREFDRANNELVSKTSVAKKPPPPPAPPTPSNTTEQQQQQAPKKKSPGFEVAGLAAALALVALAARRRKR